MSNVTPIQEGDPPPMPPKEPRRHHAKKKQVYSLAESSDSEGFTTYDVLASLRGVCKALDDLEFTRDMDIDLVAQLARAAMVLSNILYSRDHL